PRCVVASRALRVAVAGLSLALRSQAPVVVPVTPPQTTRVPLAGALLGAFAAGALLVGLVAGLRAGARRWRRWRTERHARREADRSASTARARDLVWAGDYAQARAELLRDKGAAPTDTRRPAPLPATYLQERRPEAAPRPLAQ